MHAVVPKSAVDLVAQRWSSRPLKASILVPGACSRRTQRTGGQVRRRGDRATLPSPSTTHLVLGRARLRHYPSGLVQPAAGIDFGGRRSWAVSGGVASGTPWPVP